MNPMSRLRRRFQNWIATRTPRVPGPWTIGRRRVYIVPTRYGYGYGLLLFVMLLGAMNYSNSMAFALTFLLAGIGLLAMHYTHGNLVNLSIAAQGADPVFAGDAAQFSIRLDNPSRSPRHALTIAWQDQLPLAHADVPADSSATLSLALASSKRGWLPAPRFAVATEFPLGLFHAWTWVELDLACLVYPKPAADGAAPLSSGHGDDGRWTTQRPGPDEFSGLRGYQAGDALRSIHWKSLARNPQPLVKLFSDNQADELWLDWQALPSSWGPEQRLAQLCRWVLDADAAQRQYGLRLPGGSLSPALGAQHRHACLAALALH
ncbi:DUF58 domain-containing protein [Nevskia sp.]|uniref:DUF58 domain-containing protein n=1 Tax=Nevskia sp. TaxID=1929292 RepID=UPI0025E5F56D|nr:DUF58 domain-containing protein [Nevskia sp.]